MQIEHKIPV